MQTVKYPQHARSYPRFAGFHWFLRVHEFPVRKYRFSLLGLSSDILTRFKRTEMTSVAPGSKWYAENVLSSYSYGGTWKGLKHPTLPRRPKRELPVELAILGQFCLCTWQGSLFLHEGFAYWLPNCHWQARSWMGNIFAPENSSYYFTKIHYTDKSDREDSMESLRRFKPLFNTLATHTHRLKAFRREEPPLMWD